MSAARRAVPTPTFAHARARSEQAQPRWVAPWPATGPVCCRGRFAVWLTSACPTLRERAQNADFHPRVAQQTRTLAGGRVRRACRGDRRAGVGQRKDHGGNGFDGCTAAGRAPGGTVQGGSGLHRPGLPRAGGPPAGPQSRPGAGRRAADRTALPVWQRGRRHRGGRGRHGTLRRADRGECGRSRDRIHRSRRRPARCAGGVGDRCARPEPEHRGTAARLFDLRPECQDRRSDPEPGRIAAP